MIGTPAGAIMTTPGGVRSYSNLTTHLYSHAAGYHSLAAPVPPT
jgi:hypothetical protein